MTRVAKMLALPVIAVGTLAATFSMPQVARAEFPQAAPQASATAHAPTFQVLYRHCPASSWRCGGFYGCPQRASCKARQLNNQGYSARVVRSYRW